MQWLGVEVRVVDGLKDFGGRRRLGGLRRFGGAILRILAGIRLALDVSADAVGVPALGLSVGEVPAFGHAGGRGDDADVRQLLADELDALAPGLVGIRPEQDLALGERGPIGKADGLRATRPGSDGKVGHQALRGVGGLLALDDEHPASGSDDTRQGIERAGLGKRLPAPRLLARGMLAPGDREDFLGAIG